MSGWKICRIKLHRRPRKEIRISAQVWFQAVNGLCLAEFKQWPSGQMGDKFSPIFRSLRLAARHASKSSSGLRFCSNRTWSLSLTTVPFCHDRGSLTPSRRTLNRGFPPCWSGRRATASNASSSSLSINASPWLADQGANTSSKSSCVRVRINGSSIVKKKTDFITDIVICISVVDFNKKSLSQIIVLITVNMWSSFSIEFWLQWSQILRSSGVLGIVNLPVSIFKLWFPILNLQATRLCSGFRIWLMNSEWFVSFLKME